MASAPDVLVQAVLQQGFAALAQDASGLDDLFVDRPKAVRDYLKAFLVQNAGMKVRLGWPRPDLVMPSIAVLIGSEQENPALDVLGDQQETEYTDDDGSGLGEPTKEQDVLGFGEHVQLTVLIMSRDEDATPAMYQLAKRLVFAAKMDLETAGLMNMTLAGGEFQFDPSYFPEFTYVRSLTVSADSLFQMRNARQWVLKNITLRNYGASEEVKLIVK